MKIVVKVGSNLLVGSSGLRKSYIAELCREVAHLKKQGHEVAIITSGARAAGFTYLGKGKKHRIFTRSRLSVRWDRYNS